MDSISRPEFAAIFDRVSMKIDLKQCANALAVENKLKEVRDRCKVKSKTYEDRKSGAKFGRRAEWLDTLIEADFAGRTMFEANRDPRGFIALTLKYGRKHARDRILAQKRAELRAHGAFTMVPRNMPKRPEFRRVPTHRKKRRRWQF